MAKIKYVARENKKTGTHSFYGAPVFNGKLTTAELLEEALDGKSVEPSIARAGLKAFVQQGDDRTQHYRTQAKFFKYQEDANKFKYDHDITKLRKQAKTDPVAKMELEKLEKTEEYQRFEIIEQANRSSKKEGKVGLDEFRKEIQNTTDRKEKREKQRTYNELMKGYVDLLDDVGKE